MHKNIITTIRKFSTKTCSQKFLMIWTFPLAKFVIKLTYVVPFLAGESKGKISIFFDAEIIYRSNFCNRSNDLKANKSKNRLTGEHQRRCP